MAVGTGVEADDGDGVGFAFGVGEAGFEGVGFGVIAAMFAVCLGAGVKIRVGLGV